MDADKRPFPFTSDHDWVGDCTLCPFDHPRGKLSGGARHCRKCGIARTYAEQRSDDIDVEACPVSHVGTCRSCKKTTRIDVQEPQVDVCFTCQHPDVPTLHSVGEALKYMLDVNAGVEPDPPSEKPDERTS